MNHLLVSLQGYDNLKVAVCSVLLYTFINITLLGLKKDIILL